MAPGSAYLWPCDNNIWWRRHSTSHCDATASSQWLYDDIKNSGDMLCYDHIMRCHRCHITMIFRKLAMMLAVTFRVCSGITGGQASRYNSPGTTWKMAPSRVRLTCALEDPNRVLAPHATWKGRFYRFETSGGMSPHCLNTPLLTLLFPSWYHP